MIAATSPAGLAAAVVAVIASAAFLATMVGYRSDPTTRPLIGVAAALLGGAVLHLAVVEVAPIRSALGIAWGPTEFPGGLWILLAYDLSAVVGGFWFLFALQYTGRDGQTSRLAVAVVAVLLVFLVGPNVALAVIGVGGAAALNALLGVAIAIAAALAVIGVFLVLATTLRHGVLPAAQTALLTLAVGAVLVLPFVATTLQHPVATPVAVAASSGLFTTAVWRYRVFEMLPVASVVGRERVVDEMSEGVVVTDTGGRVHDLDPRAETFLGVDQSTATGAPLAAVAPSFPDPEAAAESGAADVRTDAGHALTVTADAVTDARGRVLGHLFICRDVTEQRRREHRLAVITQLVAGTTQEQLTVVAAAAEAVAAGERAPDAAADRIRETATDVATLVARVRDVERALADREHTRSPRTEVTETVAAAGAAVDADVTAPTVDCRLWAAADPELLAATLEILATGAAASGGTVELRARDADGAVAVEVAPFDRGDDGSVAELSLRTARLVARFAGWDVVANDGDGPPTATVRLPATPDDRRRRRPGGEPP